MSAALEHVRVSALQEEEEEFEGSEATMEMLQTLQKLPWRRIDADFSATSMPFFAHNLIQVTALSVEPESPEGSKCLDNILLII